MRPFIALAWATAALAACSSSAAGGGDGGAGGGASSPGSTSTSGGDGGAAWTPSGAPLRAWTGLQGAFDSVGQEPIVEGGYVPPSPRRLVGCAVDAPDLGAYVVYLERAAMDEGAPPDRQFLVVLDDPGSSAPGGHTAAAFVGTLVTPEDWAGACVVGTTMPLRGDVDLDARCELSLVRNEIGVVGVVGAPMPGRCVSASLDATTVQPSLLIYADQVSWHDTLDGADGGPTEDPPNGATLDDSGFYELVRRSP